METILKFLNHFKEEKGTGALLDTRSKDKQLKDYHFSEIVVTVNPVNWVEKPQSEWRKFPIFNQDGSGSCVAQTMGKLLGIIYWLKNHNYVHFSATHIYQRRSNKPAPGMGGVNAFDIACDGVTLEELVPSQNMTDEQMDGVDIPDYKQKVGEVFKISSNYIQLPVAKDIDTIASVIQTTGKGVMLWFYFKRDEWTNHPVIKYPWLKNEGDVARHSVTGVDYCLVKGKKCLIIEDSWGTSYGLAGQRIIDEEFFNSRNFFAAYPMNFSFDNSVIPKPHYNFTKTLSFGENSEDIVQLQKILQYEGFFPVNVDTTGYFGSITSKAVLGWQLKHAVASVEELQSLQGRVVGPKTVAKLNELYN